MHAAHSSGWSTGKFIWGGTKETRKFCKRQHWHVCHHRQVNRLFILFHIVQTFQIHVYVVEWMKYSPSHPPLWWVRQEEPCAIPVVLHVDSSNAFYSRTWIYMREQSVMPHYSITLAQWVWALCKWLCNQWLRYQGTPFILSFASYTHKQSCPSLLVLVTTHPYIVPAKGSSK